MGMLYGMRSARILGLTLGSLLLNTSMHNALGQTTASGASSETKGPRAVQIEDMFKFMRYAEPQLSPDGKSVEEVWRGLQLEMHWSRPVLTDGKLYAFSGRNEPDAQMRCVGWAVSCSRA